MNAQVARTRNGTLALATAERTDAGMQWLTPGEERIASDLDEGRRADWIAGRLAAKRAVVGLLAAAGAALSLRSVEIRPGKSGAPRALVRPAFLSAGDVLARARAGGSRGPAPASRLALSLAHRDGRALAAATLGGRVGVDLERSWAVHPATLRYFGPHPERGAFLRGGADPTGLWALREAAWKALECAPSLPFHRLRLELDDAGRPVGVGRAPVPGSATGTPADIPLLPAAGRLWRPWPGYLGAVVVVGSDASADVVR